MKKLIVFSFLITFSTLLCNRDYRVISQDNPGWPHISHWMWGNVVAVEENENVADNKIQFNGVVLLTRGRQPSYYGVQVEIVVKNDFDITGEHLLVIDIDGSKSTLKGHKSGDEQRRVSPGYHGVLLWFPTDPDYLRKLGKGKSVEFHLIIRQQTISGKLSDENIERFDDFCSEFVR